MEGSANSTSMNETTNQNKYNSKNDIPYKAHQSLIQKIIAKIRKIYINSPVNLSSITGWRYPGIPRITGNFILGRLRSVLADSGFYHEMLAAGKLAFNHPSGMCYFWLGNKVVVIITKPNQITELLFKNNDNISRGASFELSKKFAGSSLFIDPFEIWIKKREIYSNWLLKKNILASYGSIVQKIVDQNIDYLKTHQNIDIDLEKLFEHFIIKSIVNCLFSFDVPDNDLPKISSYLESSGHNVNDARSMLKWSMPKVVRKLLFKNDKYQEFEVFKNEMRKVFNELLIEQNEVTIKNSDNFMRAIWEFRSNKTKPIIDSPDVFGDSNTVLFAGSDTTKSTLQFICMLLCAHPKVEENLRRELRMQLRGKDITFDEINKIDYLDMVIKESMRLYPAGAIIPKDVIKSFSLGGLPLSRGDIVIYSPYLSHRLEQFWEQPEKFDPERFGNKEIIDAKPRCSYIPFAVGPHNCIGQRFAMLNIKILIAMIYMNFHVEIDNNNFEVAFDMVLKPKEPVKARFTAI
jgi:cytochrome P450